MSAHLGKVKNKSKLRQNKRAIEYFNQLLANQAKESSQFYIDNMINGTKTSKEDQNS